MTALNGMPENGRRAEIASWTGQTCSSFAQALPNLPGAQRSDLELARQSKTGLTTMCPNIRAPLDLDVSSEAWPIQERML